MRKLLLLLLLCFSLPLVAEEKDSCAVLLERSQSVYYSDPDSSFALATRAEELARQHGDRASEARARWSKGRVYLLKTELEDASKEINAAQEIYQSLNDLKGKASCFKLKSIILKRVGNRSEALSTLEEAVRLSEQAGDTDGLTIGLLNLSLDYIELKQFDKAAKVLEQAATNTKPDENNFYFLHQNLGLLHEQQENYEAAITEYSIAKKFAIDHRMIDAQATILSHIGSSLGKNKQFAEAEAQFEQSLQIAQTNKLDQETLETLELYIELLEKEGKYKEALTRTQEMIALRNKILNIERINRIAALEKKLALSQKEKEVEQAHSETQQLIYVTVVVLLLFFFSLLLFLRTRKLKNEIAFQHQKLEEKNLVIEEKNKDITDSIHYAKRIQEAILPEDSALNAVFPNSFVYYKPKDIVSGDIYWLESKDNYSFAGAIDCTGHGVPGAFMSIVASNLFNQAVNEYGLTDPAAILNNVRQHLIEKLRKKNQDASIKDGMDAAIVMHDKKHGLLHYAGAYNPLWIIRNKEMHELKADKIPIGIHPLDQEQAFRTQTWKLEAGDMIYLFTDGYADQFGGSHGKKFKYKHLKQLLLANHQESPEKQKHVLNATLLSWKGELEQVDDILVMGIRF